MSADLNKQLGQPDLFVLFTNTVSHKMVKTALDEQKKQCEGGSQSYKQWCGSDRNFNTGSRSSSLKHEFIYRDHDPFYWNDAGCGTWIECRVEKRKEMK